MTEVIHKVYRRLIDMFGKSWFFVATLVLFSINTLWLILSSNLLPYDEYYHIGIIRFYANQWSPFISSQPAEMSLYGDVTRLPSYAYHFLMSFPYRFFDIFTDSETLIIIGLRIINLAVVIAGILLFRKLFLKAKVPKYLINIATLVFVSTPIVPLLVAQNNYDNLMFMLTPIVLIFACKSVEEKLNITNLLWLATVGMLATLTKHNFIVIFGAAVLYVLFILIKRHRGAIFGLLSDSIKTSKKSGLVAGVIFVIVLGLFFERYGINAIKYKQVKVDCAKVQPVSVCENFSPWRRNQKALNNIPEKPLYGDPISFTSHWSTKLMRGYYAVFANIVPANVNVPDPYGHYVFKKLLPLPITIGYILLSAGLISFVLKFKKLWHKNTLTQLTVVSSGVLLVSLWVFNYAFYLKYGQAYAIQGRYIVPMLLPLILLFATAIYELTKKSSLKWTRYIIVCMVILYVLSGGVVGWIIKSNDNWYWNNAVVFDFNRGAKNVLKRVIPH